MNEFNLPHKLKALEKSFFPFTMRMARIESEKFFKRSFDNEGFTDKGISKWKPRKDKRRGKILTKTRKLADTLKTTTRGDKVITSSPLPYAEVHNEGGTAGRNGSAKIPKRQFIGRSEKLEQIMEKEIKTFIQKKLK